MTRYDFEALLWAFLREQLDRSPDDLRAAITTTRTPTQRPAFTAAEQAEFRAALDHVKARTTRHVWDVNA